VAHWVPELLSPGGSYEKARIALDYGADAIYIAGQKFGLRTAADNFTPDEMREIVEHAHAHQRLVYVVLNSFLYDQDLEELPEFLSLLEELQVDALIVSDLGVIKTIQQYCTRPVHLSTQASCLNIESALFWKKMGVTRLVLGRETSLEEARLIKEATGLEIEMFIHGSMCMAYSGNCVISNYTQGRDSNRGGCAHSCRFDYSLDFNLMNVSKSARSFFMSSKDLEGLSLLPEFIKAGIDSLKVEGRMKSPHYAGTVSKVYSEALDFFRQHGVEGNLHLGPEYQAKLKKWKRELESMAGRDATTASLVTKANEDSIFDNRDHKTSEVKVAALVIETLGETELIAQVRHAFESTHHLELMPFEGENIPFPASEVKSLTGQPITRTKPGMLVRLPMIAGAKARQLIRQVVEVSP
jgi:U32 family peptidase